MIAEEIAKAAGLEDAWYDVERRHSRDPRPAHSQGCDEDNTRM